MKGSSFLIVDATDALPFIKQSLWGGFFRSRIGIVIVFKVQVFDFCLPRGELSPGSIIFLKFFLLERGFFGDCW